MTRAAARTTSSGPVLADLELACSPRAVRSVRHLLTAAAQEVGLDEDTTEALVLMASELVTNAVVHGRDPLHVHAQATGRGTVVLEVRDKTPGQVVPYELDLWSTGGRGLAMVDMMAYQWGCRSDTGGKVVWCETVPVEQP